MQKYVSLFFFILIPLAAGSIIGAATAPGAWYADLTKPWFNPPGWIFGPVWTVLYVLIGLAGWRIWQRDRASAAMALWCAQMALNWLWSPVFFTWHAIGLAFVVILALLASIVWLIALTWKADRLAASLLIPYALWVGFATILNAAIWRLN